MKNPVNYREQDYKGYKHMQHNRRIYNKVSNHFAWLIWWALPFLVISSMEEMMVYRQSLVQTLYHSSSQGYEVAPLAENVSPWKNQVALSVLLKQKMGAWDNLPPRTRGMPMIRYKSGRGMSFNSNTGLPWWFKHLNSMNS